MSKSSFNEIEQAIKAAAEAHEPAFDEQAWKKMEELLDKEKDRKRPIAFWLWLVVPVLIGSAGYFIFSNADKNKPQQSVAVVKEDKPASENISDNNAQLTVAETNTPPVKNDKINSNASLQSKQKETKEPADFKEDKSTSLFISKQTNDKAKVNAGNSTIVIAKGNTKAKINYGSIEEGDNDQSNFKKDKSTSSFINKHKKEGQKINHKNNFTAITKAKTVATIKPGTIEEDNAGNENIKQIIKPEQSKSDLTNKEKEDVVVIKVDAAKTSDKEIEKIIDSVAEKLQSDKKSKKKISRFYIVAAGGAEANGVKLFSAGKITTRAGLGLGYQLNKNISLQTGLYISSKKYKATASDYKTKPGSYWNMVDIKTIDANCRVYEIPVTVLYNFTPGKKVNIFASASLSSYIMKKEDYQIYYDHYGVPQQAAASYTGNQNLFSVLRLSAGIEKKISKNFSIMASPGVAIPLAGVGEGEVKLYTTDIMIGIKFTLPRKK